jgi:energy-converting hydrogenase Eha subunit A
MASAVDATLEYEIGQTPVAMKVLTDVGDTTRFASSNDASDIWSGVAGFAPIIRPNGLITGGAVTPAASDLNNLVDIAALTCYLAGEKVSVAASTLNTTLTRGAVEAPKIIHSITVTSTGDIAVISGDDHTAFSETRGAPGAPPLIPVGSIEIAQVRLRTHAADQILSSDILAIPNIHQERFDYPSWEVDYSTGSIVFTTPLPKIHTGSLPKKIYGSYAEPTFAQVGFANDFTAPEETYSSSSQQVYGGTVGASSKSLSAGSFTAYLKDGISDAILGLKGKKLWFRFKSDKYSANHILCQGVLGIARSFPVAGNISAKCSISPETAAVDRVS